MKAAEKLNPYVFVLLQSSFAGVLLGQLLNLMAYREAGNWFFYLTVWICVGAGLLISFFKKNIQLYLFRHISFNWIYFFSTLLWAVLLLFFLLPLLLGVGEGFKAHIAFQLSSLFALTMVLLESWQLEQDVLQKVKADLRGVKNPGVVGKVLLALPALAIFSLLSIFLYQRSAAGLLESLEPTLILGSILWLLFLGLKTAHYRWLVSARKEPAHELQKEGVSHYTMVQQEYFYLEKNLEKILIESRPEERPFFYKKIRQVPLIDKLRALEQIQESLLLNDAEFASTILFLKSLKERLLDKGAHYDIDAVTDLMEVKGYIRSVITAGSPMLVQKLLNDNRPEVRKAAVFASVHFQETGFIPVLVNLLKEPEYAFSAKEALFEIGDHCIPFLRSAKYRNKADSFFISQCLELVERFKSKEAREFLLEMLNEPQKRFQYQAALALLKNEYVLTGLHKTQLLHFIESLIGLIAVQREIRLNLEEKDVLLKEALYEEETAKAALVKGLLKAFLSRPVHALFLSIEAQTAKSPFSLYALIDLHFPLVLRNKCKIVLGSLPGENIAPALQAEYVNEQIHFSYRNAAEAIRQILKIDYGQIGYWLRVCALKQLGQLKGQQISTEMLAEIFNENPLLQETASELLYDLNYDYYFLYMQRLPTERAKGLKHKIELYKTLGDEAERAESYLLRQQVLFLKSVSIFQACSYESLARHSSLFSLHTFQEEEGVLNPDPYKANGYWIVCQGTLTFYYSGKKIAEAQRGDVIDLSFLSEAASNTVTIRSKNLPQVYFIEYSTLNNLYLSSGFFQNTIIQPEIKHVSSPILA